MVLQRMAQFPEERRAQNLRLVLSLALKDYIAVEKECPLDSALGFGILDNVEEQSLRAHHCSDMVEGGMHAGCRGLNFL